MGENKQAEELLEFLKVLADASRLKIVGVLAIKPMSVEQIAAAIGLEVSTTSHHLARLSKANLVSARAEGHYYFYSLRKDILEEKTRQLLNVSALSQVSTEVNMDAYDQKIIRTFTNAEGRIKAFPAQEKKFLVIVRYVLRDFKPGIRYTEKQVNEILARYHDDVALLRRSLVEYKYMQRQGGGGEYWVTETSE